jgi:hypothetical protein
MMKRALLPLLMCLTACAPVVVGDDSDGSTDEGTGAVGPDGSDDADGEGELGEDGEGDGEGNNEEEEEEEVEPPELTLASGDWEVSGAALVDDPCDFVGVVEDWWGTDFGELLPSEFEVEGDEGRFDIEAQSYGAQGPISCTITDGSFSCEQQEVDPLTFDLDEYGWSYEIDFSGEVSDENTIRGTAVVSYPSVDDYTEYYLGEAGIRPEDCTQVLELELSFDR